MMDGKPIEVSQQTQPNIVRFPHHGEKPYIAHVGLHPMDAASICDKVRYVHRNSMHLFTIQHITIMKPTYCLTIILATLSLISCDQQKSAIEENKDATKQAIDMQKSEVKADAQAAIRQTETNAKIDKARIEANQESIQAQLDADKKVADAEAAAAKDKVDAEK
jgi:hypothetical protein